MRHRLLHVRERISEDRDHSGVLGQFFGHDFIESVGRLVPT